LTFPGEQLGFRFTTSLSILLACVGIAAAPPAWAGEVESPSVVELRLTVKTPLELRNVPLDPEIDFAAFIRQSGRQGVLDPDSIEVTDAVTGERVPHALGEGLVYGDRGRVEFVIADPSSTAFRLRFRVAATRPPSRPQRYTPLIGTGDLLRYNAAVGRPIVLAYSMGLHDVTGDGKADLVGTWNYARRPGEPGDAVVCYPRVCEGQSLEFGELVRLRRSTKGAPPTNFDHIYASTDFADLNADGRLDMLYVPSGANKAEFFLNTGQRDGGGLPIFAPAGECRVTGWMAARVVDLDGDGAADVVVDGSFVRNENRAGWPFQPAAPVKLNAGRQPCFVDVDRDGRLDAVCLSGPSETLQPDFYRIAWRRNLGGTSPPTFGPEQLLTEIDVPHCSMVAAYRDGDETGLLVQHDALQSISMYRLLKEPADGRRFERRGRAESISAPLALGDQATPCVVDWDDDGDLDLLVGGGHGWPRVVINEGTRRRPVFSEPHPILADGKPIRLLRNDILGPPKNWHDMGYMFPAFVDWDGDGRRDLMLPNETNRIFWYRNAGTAREPVFGERQQLLCEGFPDSAELRGRSAQRAAAKDSKEGAYPREPEQPFFWRTGVAFADFDGDGLMDMATHDGADRRLTLFTQFRDATGELRLRKARRLKLTDGRPIDDAVVGRTAQWTESFRAIDWDGDGLTDLLYSVAGAHHGSRDGGSIYLLRNAGTRRSPVFEPPRTMRCFGQPIRFTHHGPHPWPADLDGDGQMDLIAYTEWSVYPFFSHAALSMPARPTCEIALVSPGS
jgi:hypothetical protein